MAYRINALNCGGISMSTKRTTADAFDPEVLKLFDLYVHGDISRRHFLQSVTQFAVGVTSLALLDALNPRFAGAQQVAGNDPHLTGQAMWNIRRRRITANCAVVWCSLSKPKVNCRRCWWCMRIAGLIRISKILLGAWRWITLSLLRRTRCFPWVATRGMSKFKGSASHHSGSAG